MEPLSRSIVRSEARRVVVKAGTSVVTNEDGRPSLVRLGALVEQISELHRVGIQVIFVSSGAVGMGKRLLRKQTRLNMSFSELQNRVPFEEEEDMMGGHEDAITNPVHRVSSFLSFVQRENRPSSAAEIKKTYDSACAAAGQFEMMNLYSSLFNQFDVVASQLLLTQLDFTDTARLTNLRYAVDRLLAAGIVPIINENDAVSANLGYTQADIFSDNDSLAALCARSFHADVCLLLTDVDGVYDRPPSEEGANLIKFFPASSLVEIGQKSARGRGGMQAKINAALSAVQPGSKTFACIVASGTDLDSIRATLHPKYYAAHSNSTSSSSTTTKGTLFVTPGSKLEQLCLEEINGGKEQQRIAKSSLPSSSISEEARQMAIAARTEARKLQALPYADRQAILNAIAQALLDEKQTILKANAQDLIVADKNRIAPPLMKRLKLAEEKLVTLAAGLRQIAQGSNPLGSVKSQREIADGLVLSQITVPIGVLMVIFESRPDSLPQIAALAIASSNGLLLKGGKEAAHSNATLHTVIGSAIENASQGRVSRDLIGLVTHRGQVADMLALDDVIDLVIPRGGNELVSYIKANTRIPVLGHADGICHVYVDESATSDAACKIVLDAKTDYPSACNAMETLLLHKGTLKNGVAMDVLMRLRKSGVKCLGGPNAMKMGLCDVPAEKLRWEYGDLTCMVEVVQDLQEAVDWIHLYGSGHTESIVCSEDSPAGEEFLKSVDAACVFKNASTRFADGFRFGLGAEVGISTGRIHSRGPVGVEGLLTTKWILRSSSGSDCVQEFSGDNPTKVYTHKELV